MIQRVKEQALQIYEQTPRYILGIMVGVIILVVSGITLFINHENKSADELSSLAAAEDLIVEEEKIAEETLIENEERYIFVDIKGEIKNPGVYEMCEGDRLLDVVEQAGGLKEQADESLINLAQKLVDEMVIYIPKVGEEGYELKMASMSNSSSEKEEKQININTADIEELKQLSGIGDAKANNIINYREENGSFKTIDELKNVSGIGDRIFEQLADKISVN